MAISSSFASRLVLRIAPALLFSFVCSISTSYAARIHLPLYDGPSRSEKVTSSDSMEDLPSSVILSLNTKLSKLITKSSLKMNLTFIIVCLKWRLMNIRDSTFNGAFPSLKWNLVIIHSLGCLNIAPAVAPHQKRLWGWNGYAKMCLFQLSKTEHRWMSGDELISLYRHFNLQTFMVTVTSMEKILNPFEFEEF